MTSIYRSVPRIRRGPARLPGRSQDNQSGARTPEPVRACGVRAEGEIAWQPIANQASSAKDIAAEAKALDRAGAQSLVAEKETIDRVMVRLVPAHQYPRPGPCRDVGGHARTLKGSRCPAVGKHDSWEV